MASISPFNMEDQTDEDFFDKLVEDDFEPTVPSSPSAAAVKSTVRNDSDNAMAFANLSIGDDSGDEELIHKEKEISETNLPVSKELMHQEKEISGSPADNTANLSVFEEPMHQEKEITDSSAGNQSNLPPSEELMHQENEIRDPSAGNIETLPVESHLPESNSGSVMELENKGSELEADVLSRSDLNLTSTLNRHGSSGVKELDWNSFYADSMNDSGNNGLDFFSELESNAAGFPGSTVDESTAMGIANGNEIASDNPVSYGEYHENLFDGNNMDQTSDSQYWENMYPGWKYDPATAQWYQVDNQEQSVTSLPSCETSDGITEVSYYRQSSQSAVSAIAEASTADRMYNVNQDSQPNGGGYPDHMVFDPQYPGWYYDTITQQWCPLDSYTAYSQSTGQVHDLQSQSGFGSSDGYSNDAACTMLDGNALLTGQLSSEDLGSQWSSFNGVQSNQSSNIWQPETETMASSGFDGNQQVANLYNSNGFANDFSTQHMSEVHTYENASQRHYETNGVNGTRSFVPDMNMKHQYNATNEKQTGQMGFSTDFFGSPQPVQQSFQDTQQIPFAPSSGRSRDGRPPHALVTFGFGGKLIVMKDSSSAFGSQPSGGNSISLLNVAEAAGGGSESVSGLGAGTCSYMSALCHQSYPGPLVGGSSVGSKELNKWIDERISTHESLGSEHRKEELLKLLYSLLKIGCVHYGKFRSPFGTNTAMKESDSPESAVAKLFASAKKKGMYGATSHCLQHIPMEEQIQTSASQVQNLLISGRKMEALQCAQEGQLWGPALIIATQLGEQFYVDTVKQMALRQLVAGSPLRTLCLLIAGQPAEVFSSNNTNDHGLDGSIMMSYQNQGGCNGMLDDWEENLAVITSNRTKDDELVITHLGDCLWKDRSEIVAAHICYVIAEMNFEAYSDTARLCLIGADHWKLPRTYATPEAIQMTELYEYSKVMGNSQYVLVPFQPYKIIYAYMLAEVGKLSDALKYCQAVQKSLKTGRAPEVDAWKQLVSSLEDRIRIHQQGGYTNLAPAKLVGKLLNFFDSTAHRVVGGLPPPAPTSSQASSHSNGLNSRQATPSRVSASQSTTAMSSLMPSASMEPISGQGGGGDGTKMTMYNRSVSEPDFSRTPKQGAESSAKEGAGEGHGKESGSSGASRLSRFGFLQKTVDLVRWSKGRQAKLGEENKFYYDEKLKRWVEKGADVPAEEAALPPPPTAAAFQNGTSEYGGGMRSSTSDMSPSSSSPPGAPMSMSMSMSTSDGSLGMPPIPTSSNQFSSRGRTGVRARYVDTFNKGRPAASVSTFRPPGASSVKPPLTAKANMFIPAGPAHDEEHQSPATAEPNTNTTQVTSSEDHYNSISSGSPAQSFQTPPPMTMQRFPSMGHISTPSHPGSSSSSSSHGGSRRTASWGGGGDGPKSLGEVMGLPHTAYMTGPPLPAHLMGEGEDLDDVQL